MRNLKLLEKYKPNPPPAIKKKEENLNLQENEKTSLLVNGFNHPKIASTIMKKPQTPYLEILNFSKKPKSIGKVFNSFEVTRPIKPSPHEKISIPENLPPFKSKSKKDLFR